MTTVPRIAHVKCPCCGGDLTVYYSGRTVFDTEGCECSLYLEQYGDASQDYEDAVRQNVLKEIRYYG